MTVACPRCGADNEAARKVCLRCGVSLSAKVTDVEAALSMVPLPSREDSAAREAARKTAMLGSIFPGLGHFQSGAWLRGTIFLLPVMVFSVLGIRDFLSAMADLTERLSNLEPAGTAVAGSGSAIYRATGYFAAAVVVHLVSVFDAYRVGRRSG